MFQGPTGQATCWNSLSCRPACSWTGLAWAACPAHQLPANPNLSHVLRHSDRTARSSPPCSSPVMVRWGCLSHVYFIYFLSYDLASLHSVSEPEPVKINRPVIALNRWGVKTDPFPSSLSYAVAATTQFLHHPSTHSLHNPQLSIHSQPTPLSSPFKRLAF